MLFQKTENFFRQNSQCRMPENGLKQLIDIQCNVLMNPRLSLMSNLTINTLIFIAISGLQQVQNQ